MPPALSDYEYALGESGFVLNADFNGTFPFVDVTDIAGLDGAPLRSSSSERESFDGAYVDSKNMSLRTIVISGTVYADPQDAERICDQLRAAYSDPTVQPFYFKHPAVSLRFVMAQGGGAKYDIDTNRRVGQTPIQLSLLCADPYIYDYPGQSGKASVGSSIVVSTTLNPNTGFETDTSGWTPRNGATIVQSSAFAYAGTNSCLLTPLGAASQQGMQTDQFAVTPGNYYTLLSRVLSDVNWPAGAFAYINWYDGSNSLIPGTQLKSNIPSLVASQWSPLTLTQVAPAGAATGKMVCEVGDTPTNTNHFYFDECYFIQDPGLGFNVGFNTGFGPGISLPSITLVNNGTHDAYPIYTLVGPLTNPVVIDAENDTSMQFNLTLSASDSLVVDCKNRSVILNGTAGRRNALQGRSWFSVPKNSTATFLLFASSGTGSISGVLYSTYY